jgi:hypothetical protein
MNIEKRMQKIIEYFPEEDFLIPHLKRKNKKASRTFFDIVISQLIIENIFGCLKYFAIKGVMESC